MKKNIIFAAVILLVAGILAVWGLTRDDGLQAEIKVVNGVTTTVSLNDNHVYAYPSEDTGAALDFTIEVNDGAVRFINSQCADHVCEGFGWLRRENEQAICLPAGVVVTIQE